MPRLTFRSLGAASLIIGLGAAIHGPCQAQTFSPYADFVAMSPGQLAALQVKLTWMGPEVGAVPTHIIVAVGTEPNTDAFAPCHRPGLDYSNDDFELASMTASLGELDALIDSVGTLATIPNGGVDEEGYLSFSLVNIVAGDTLCFEAVVNDTNGRALFGKMRAALQGNQPAVMRLSAFACMLDMAGLAPPQEVSASVLLHFRGVRQDRTTGEYVGTVKVKNTSASVLLPPLSLMLEVQDPNVILANADGSTCRISPSGRSYVNLPVGSGLSPGTTVESELRFTNVDRTHIDLYFVRLSAPGGPVAPRLFAGPGER